MRQIASQTMNTFSVHCCTFPCRAIEFCGCDTKLCFKRAFTLILRPARLVECGHENRLCFAAWPRSQGGLIQLLYYIKIRTAVFVQMDELNHERSTYIRIRSQCTGLAIGQLTIPVVCHAIVFHSSLCRLNGNNSFIKEEWKNNLFISQVSHN